VNGIYKIIFACFILYSGIGCTPSPFIPKDYYVEECKKKVIYWYLIVASDPARTGREKDIVPFVGEYLMCNDIKIE
jgi:hypothetical protein